jgi:hypothetical protein
MQGGPHEEFEVLRGCLVVLLLTAGATWAQGKSVIRHQPLSDDPEERPVAAEITVSGEGAEFAVRMVFNKPPAGACGRRCANATVFLDLDGSRKTGLQIGAGAETGADLAITVQALPPAGGGEAILRAKVRTLPDTAASLEDGELVAELDPTMDADRMQVDGQTVLLLVDVSRAEVRLASRARVIYHPPGAKALTAEARVSPPRGIRPQRAGGEIEVIRAGERVKGGKGR